jgi:hypothetical protein
MKAKMGMIITEASGSLGGHTFQNSKGGFQIRNKPIPHGNPSAAQISIRAINQQLQAGWRALTTAQQKIWNDWPSVHGIFNAKNDKHPLSGHSLWMKYNYSWFAAGGVFLPDPSWWGGPIIGNNLIPEASSSFFTNGTDYWGSLGDKVWNPATHDMTVNFIAERTYIYAQLLTPGLKYRCWFDIKGSLHVPINVRNFSGLFWNNITNLVVTDNFQTMIFESTQFTNDFFGIEKNPEAPNVTGFFTFDNIIIRRVYS